MLQRQVRFNRVLEKVVQSQVRFNRVPQGSGEGSGEVLKKPWCKAKSSLTGSGEGCREGPREGFGNLWCRARSVSNRFNRVFSTWLCSTLQKDL